MGANKWRSINWITHNKCWFDQLILCDMLENLFSELACNPLRVDLHAELCCILLKFIYWGKCSYLLANTFRDCIVERNLFPLSAQICLATIVVSYNM